MQYQGGKFRVSNEISDTIVRYMGGYNLLRYQGGKSAIAKDISKQLLSMRGGQTAL